MHLIPLQPRDNVTAATLDADTCFDPYASEWDASGYSQHFEQGGHVTLWHTPDGLPIGIASWYLLDDSSDYPERDTPASVYLARFGIHCDYRRNGHGTAFFNALLTNNRAGFSSVAAGIPNATPSTAHVVSSPVTRVWLYARHENAAGHAFWESLGFEKTGEEDVDGHTYAIFQQEFS